MINKVYDTVLRYDLISPNDSVGVALSGGADSMALLHVLLQLRERFGITLTVLHLNHQIRGEEAERDQAFVEDVCQWYNLPLFCKRVDVPQYAKSNKMSIELAARELRYAFFSEFDGKVATAHHADDHLETLIFRLTRGTGLHGLAGIPPKRGPFIRPLIECTRNEIEAYCKKEGISFVTDSTNASDEYTRNRIRHLVIPELKKLNVSLNESVLRLSESVRLDEDYLESVSDREYQRRLLPEDTLSVERFDELHEAIARRVLIKHFDRSLDAHHIKELYQICLQGGRCSLPGHGDAIVKNGILCTDKPFQTYDFSVQWKKRNVSEVEKETKIHNLFENNRLDCDKIVGKLVLRTRNTGDTICLYEKQGSKSLKKLFCEKKVPAELRHQLPVLADEQGVVWIYGIGVAHRCRVDKKTSCFFEIETKTNFKGKIKNESE